MRSIKPGRGPSMQGGIAAIVSIVFGVFWTILASSMTAGEGMIGVIFPLFGLCFIGMGIMNAVYHFKNATGENRYSSFDIVDDDEETDPLNKRFGAKKPDVQHESKPHAGGFCPYCGASAEGEYAFCRKCGRGLPK